MELSFTGPALPAARRAAWGRRLRPTALLLLTLAFLVACMWPTSFDEEIEDSIEGFAQTTPHDHFNFILSLVMLHIVTIFAAVVLLHARTACLMHVAIILLIMWAGEAALALKYFLQFRSMKDYGLAAAVSLGCLHGVGFGVQKTFVHNCMADIEGVLGIDLGSSRLRHMLTADAFLSVLIVSAAASHRLCSDLDVRWPEILRILASTCCWAFLLKDTIFAFIAYDRMGRVIRTAEGTAERLEEEAKSRSRLWHQSGDPDIQSTFGKLRSHRCHVTTLCLTRVLAFGHIMLFGGFLWPIPANLRNQAASANGLTMHVLTDSVCIVNLWYLYLLVVLWYVYGGVSALIGVHARIQEEELRLLKRAFQQSAFVSDSDLRWQATVEDLASRAITVEALLDFYAGLGRDYMPRFNPDRHTTHDVVRQAIIPLSASAGSDMAKLLMKGQRLSPNVMVSHTWRGCFRDLVAAVVADSLGEQEYGRIGTLLDSDMGLLKHWISISQDSGLERSYWICAFSVNQHRSICSPTKPHNDSVTGVRIPPCGCSCPKFLNTDEPCRADGASIYCEMNKFGDMMAWLAARDSSFIHVLAMDGDLDLLKRAWCVAEAAESYIMGMSQHMKVSSLSNIRRRWAKVKQLRVEDMEATRPEDVIEILQRIPNKAEFNTQLQKLFDRLFGTFWHLPPSERVRMMCRELRWRMNVVEAVSQEASSRKSTEASESQLERERVESARPEMVWPQSL